MRIVNTDKFSYAFRLLKAAFWSYRSKFLLMLGLGLAAGIFGGIGIGAIIPLFSFLTKGQSTETDIISKTIEKFFSLTHLPYNLPLLLAFMVVIFILKAIVHYLSYHYNQKLSTDYEKQSRSELFKKTLHADWPYLLEQKIGHLETVLFQDIYTSAGILTCLSGLIMTATSLVLYALIAVNISASITFLTFGIGLILFFLLKPLFFKLRRTAAALAALSKQVTHHISEHTIGAKTVKTMGADQEVIKHGDEYFENYRKMRVKIELYNRLPGTFLEPVGFLFISLVLLYQYYFGNVFSIASFAAIVYIVQKEFSFMQALQSNLNNINQALPHLKIVMDYQEKTARHAEINSGLKLFRLKENIEFKNISFAYDKKNKILSGLNFLIKKGEAVGLIGSSGAGKTTLVDLILRLFPPGSGEILVDGQNAFEIDLAGWRKKIGYVSQDTFLLNDTIENNIRFYNKHLTKEEVKEAAELAHIRDFIEKQPNKFSTVVGERGVKLSGGQKQRIILARVLARKPEFLILDEATSALDNESEALIQKSIEHLRGKTTVLIIAHRLSTIMSTDNLFVLENGKITEQGAPQELLKDKDSYFYKIYNIREK